MKNERIKRYTNEIRTKNFIIRKISNPNNCKNRVDGLIPGGDRSNSYVWAMAETKKYIYIGSNRNLLLNSINLFITNDTLANVITKLVFRGDVPTDVDDNAARIFRYNKSTKQIELVYKSETDSDGIVYETGYRSAITFKASNEDSESVYMGGFGPKYARILKFKDNFVIGIDNPEVVFFDESGFASIRSIEIYNNKLYFGMMIIDSDLVIMESENPSKDNWNVVANLNSFQNIPNVDQLSTGYGGIFDLIDYNGYLYAIIGSGSKPLEESGFLVFKGKPIETIDEYDSNFDWNWQMIVGPGAKYEAGLGIPYHAVATPFKYTACDGNEYVYVGTFSNIIYAIQRMTQFDFSYLYESFKTPTTLYRFDENDNWDLVIGTPNDSQPFETALGNYKAGFVSKCSNIDYSSNQYIWRMSNYNDKLFLGTFDSATLYDYLIPKNIPYSLNNFKEILKFLLNYLIQLKIINSSKAYNIIDLFKNYTNLSNTPDKISLVYACSHSNEMKPSEYLEEHINNLNINVDLNLLSYFNPFLPNDLSTEITGLISDINFVNCGNYLNKNVLSALDTISKKFPYDTINDDEKYLGLIYENLSYYFGDGTVDAIRNAIDKCNNNKENLILLISKIKNYLNSDEIARQIYYIKEIRKMLDNSLPGFDFFVSNDGLNFSRITRNGFNDKFNYGLRTFISSNDCLYIGTANPFYGGQLWKLTEI